MSANLMIFRFKYLRNTVFLVFSFCVSYQVSWSQANFVQARHETLLQTQIDVTFDANITQAAPNTAGWTITLNSGGTDYPLTPTLITCAAPSTVVELTFNASPTVPGHAGLPFLLPGETLKVSYDNTLGNLTAAGGVPSFTDQASANNYAPIPTGVGDMQYQSQGIASSSDQCSPVNTNFYRWTYVYSLRYRNSTNWNTNNNQLNITWGNGAGTTPNLPGYLSNSGGDPSTTQAPVNIFTASSYPGVYVSFRTGLNIAAANAGVINVDGSNQYIYPNNTGVCNFYSTEYPVGVTTAVYSASGVSTLTTNKQFDSYDYDNQLPGTMGMTDVAIGTAGATTTNLVCVGSNVGAVLSDNSVFNCIGNGTLLSSPAANPNTTPVNNAQRWVRIVYGGVSAATVIPDIHVNGAQVTTNAAVSTLNPLYVNNPNLVNSYASITDFTPNGTPLANGYVVPGAAIFPASTPGTTDVYGVTALNVGSATTSGILSQLISTLDFSNQAVGQQFNVTIQYWNVCNPYPSSAPVEYTTTIGDNNAIQIIDKPIPLTATGLSICYNGANGGNNPTNFTVGGVTGGAIVKFYKDKATANAHGATLQSGASTSLSTNNYTAVNGCIGAPYSTNNQDGKYYSVWATQFLGTCESEPIEVVIYQQPRLNNLAADIRDVPTPNPAPDVCNNTSVIYTEPEAVPIKTIPIGLPANGTNAVPINLNTENVWTSSGASTVTITPSGSPNGSASYAYAISPQPTTFVTVNVGVALQYVTPDVTNVPANVTVTTNFPAPTLPSSYSYTINSQTCINTATTLPQKVYGTSAGGDISPSTQTNCGLIAPAAITVAGTGPMPMRGNVVSWQKRVNGIGGFVPDVTLGSANPLALTTAQVPVVSNAQTTYEYQAIVQNGPCTSALSPIATVIVNPIPAQPTITPSGPTTFCLGSSVTLTSSSVNAVAYQWFKNGVAIVGATSSTYLINTIAQSGTYTVQTVGAAPTVCLSPVSAATVVTVNPLPTATVSGGGSVCGSPVQTPAPDITWTFTGTPPFNFTVDRSVEGPILVTGYNSMTYTIVGPLPPSSEDYQITSLSDNNSCIATSLGGIVTVNIIGISPPSPESFTSTPAVCDDSGTTNPPDAILDLLPDSPETYSIGYKLKNLNTGVETIVAPSNFTSDASGVITISPTYAQLGSAPEPLGYQIIITSIFNITTLCAGAVPINGPILIVNPRPSAPTGPVNSIACSTGGGTAMSVDDPGLGFSINWSTTAAPTFTNAVPGSGNVSGSNNSVFTPNSSSTVTFFAFIQNSGTGCLSSTSVAVNQIQDVTPAASFAGVNQPNVCGLISGSPTVTLGATAANNLGNGTWTVPGKIAYYQNFENFGIGTTTSTAYNGWTVDVSNPNAFPQQGGTTASQYFQVKTGKQFEARNTNGSLGIGVGNIGEVVWSSSVFDISAASGFPAVTASVDVINVSNDLNGGADADYVKVFYKLDGGVETLFAGGNLIGNFANTTATTSGLVGNTLQIVIRISTNAGTETVAFDNIIVRDPASTISFADANDASTIVSNLPAPAPGGAAQTTPLKWTVASALGACAASSSTMTVTINPLPTSLTITPQLCDDLAGAPLQTANVDLTSYSSSVSDAISNLGTVDWYNNAIDRNAGINKITAPVTVLDGQQFFFRATSPSPFSCLNDGSTTFTINALPTVANQNLSFCEDHTGTDPLVDPIPPHSGQHGPFDLTVYDAAIANGSLTDRTVTWYSDNTLMTLVPTPTAYTLVGTQTLYAKVVDTSKPTNCFSMATINLTTLPRPKDNPVQGSATACTGNSIILYQLDPTFNPASTYTWTVTGAAASVFGGGGSNTPNFFVLLKFPGPTIGTVDIDVFETLNGCDGNVQHKTISVNTAPVPNTIDGATEVCANQTAVPYSVHTPSGSSTYAWSVVGATPSGSGALINVDFSTITPVTIQVTETTTATGCVGTPATALVNVNPLPLMTSANILTYCSGDTPPVPFFTSNIGSTYSWKVVNITGSLTGVVNGQTGTDDLGLTFTGASAIRNQTGAVGSVTFNVTPIASTSPNCVGATQSLVVTINPEPVLVVPQQKTICSNTQVNYEIITTPSNLPANNTFTWLAPTMSDGSTQGNPGTNVPAGAAGTLHITDNLINTTNAQITATYSVTPKSGAGCSGSPQDVVIKVNPEPVMTSSNLTTLCSGTAPTLVFTSSIASNYAWTVTNITGTLTGINIGQNGTGDLAATFSGVAVIKNISLTTATVTLQVTPTATSGSPLCVGTPQVVMMQVDPEPLMTSSATISICSKGAPSLIFSSTIAANYHWTVTNILGTVSGITIGQNGIGDLKNTYVAGTIINTSGSSATVTISVVPVSTAALGCAGAPPQTVTLTVNPEPVMTSVNTSTVCSGITPPLVFSSNVASVFDWKITNISGTVSNAVNGQTGSGNLSNTFNGATAIVNTSGVQATITFSVIPTSTTGTGCIGSAQIVTLKIDPQPQMTSSNSDAICSGGTPILNFTSDVASNYNWTVKNILGTLSGVVIGQSGVGDLSLTYAGSTAIHNTTISQGKVTFDVIPTSTTGTGCIGSAQTVTLSVNAEPVMTSATNPLPFCSNTVPSLTFTSSIASSYNWTVTGITGTLASVSNGQTGTGDLSLTFTGAGKIINTSGVLGTVTFSVVPVSNPGNCTGAAQIVTITINPEPVMTSSNSSGICSGQTPSLVFSSDIASTYNWQVSGITGTVTGVSVSQSGTGNLSSTFAGGQAIKNVSAGSATVQFQVTPTSATGSGCVGSTQPVALTVNPEPVMSSPIVGNVCSGQVPTHTFTSSIAATYNWSVTNINGSLSGVTLLQSGSGDLSLTFTTVSPIRNISTISGIVTFNVVPVTAGCSGAPQVFKLTVNPEPTGLDFTQPGCVNATPLNYNIQGQVSNIASAFTYTVTSDNAGVPAGPDRTSASNALIPDTYTNVTGTVANIIYLITPHSSSNNCPGSTFHYFVKVSPVPTGSGTPGPPDLCSRSPINIDPQSFITNGVASTFSWVATYDLGLTGGGSGARSGPISETLNNVTGGMLKVKYTITPSSGDCTGNNFDIIQKINPEPVMTPITPFQICSSNSFISTTTSKTLSVSNGVPALFNITANQDLALTGTASTGNGLGSNAIFSDKFGNTTSTQLIVTYTVIPVANLGGCLGSSTPIVTQINPEPVLISSGVPQVCSTNLDNPANPINVVLGTNGTSATVAVSGYELIADLQFSNGGPFSTTLPPGFTIVSATPKNFPGDLNLIKQDTYKNTSNVSVTVRYLIQAKSVSGCLSVPLNYDVVIKPEPILAPGGIVPTCSGVSAGVAIALGAQAGSIAIDQYTLKQASFIGPLTPSGTNAALGTYLTNSFLEADVFTNAQSNSAINVSYLIAPSAAGCPGADQTVVLKVNPAPAVSPNLNAIVCSGGASGIILATTSSSAAARPSLGYFITNIAAPQLQADAANVGINAPPGGTGVNTNYIAGDKFINNTDFTQTATYSVQAITTANCIGPIQNVVLTVEPTIIATPTPLVSGICSKGVASISLQSTSTPSAGPVTFDFTAASTIGGQLSGFTPSAQNLPIGGPTAPISDILLNNSNSSADVVYTITPWARGAKGGGGCPGSPVPVTVHVEPIPKLIASPLTQTVCEGVASHIILTTPTSPSSGTVQFILSPPASDLSLSGTPAPGPYTNGQSIADVWNNNDTAQGTVVYSLQPAVNGGLGCVGEPVTITLHVNPLPNLSYTFISPTALCSNNPTNIELTSDVSGTINSWPTPTLIAGVAGGFSSGAGDLIFQTIKNPGNIPATVRYHVTPKANGCTGVAKDIDVEVDPIPEILFNKPSPVCYGSTLNVPLTSSVAGTNFSWLVDPNNSGVDTNPAGGNTINYVVKDTLSSAEDFIQFTISAVGPGATACPATDKSMTVIASPQMDGKFLNDNTAFCEGPKDFLQIQLNGQAPFTVSYTDGTSNFTLTKVGNFKSIPIKPTTTTNYLLVSMKDVNGCSISLSSQVLYTVYANVAAGFTIGPIPKFVGGNATVTFTNTSAPLDATQFTYDWTFGDDSSPESASGVGPFSVNYRLPGRKNVTLVAYNNSAQAAGLSCTSSITKTFNILLDPLVAEFKIDPTKACYPIKIKVIENLSTGDLFKWSVIDQKSRDTVASSNAAFPIFSISNDGSYFVRLVTGSSFTGQTATDTANLILYPKPEAIFDAYPQTVYIPDQEVTTINGSGNTATQWLWEFGDGDTSTDYQPSHKYKFEGVDSLKFTAQYDHGGGVICSSTNYKIITAKQGGVAKIPNAFTPSTAGPSGGVGGVDLYNYVFLPQVKGVEEFNMQIFDRWGNLIFESNSQTIGWDGYDQHGKLMPGGVYVYKLTLRLSDQQRTTQVGDVTLIR